jgi:RNA polymerase sigma-70 factor (ECF subfamily)
MYVDGFRKNYTKNEYLLSSSDNLYLFEQISVDDFSETLCETNHLKDLVKELMAGFEDNVHIQAFNMNVIDGIDYKDIAIQHNIPLGTVKSRVFRAKKLLQEKYRSIYHKYDESAV